MAVIAVVAVVPGGVEEPALTGSAAGGDAFLLDASKKTYLRCKNAHAANPRTFTIASQLPAGAIPTGAAAANLAVVVPALKTYVMGPIDPVAYRDANGRAVVTYSDAAADCSVTPFSV